MLVSEFVEGFKNLKKPELQKDFCQQHIKTTYASIIVKNAWLKKMIDACVKRNDSGILYIDMVANKINFTNTIICLYTDLELDVAENGRGMILEAYDMFQENGIIDIFCDLIGEREINELILVNKEALNTWHEEHSTTRAYVSDMIDKAVRTFTETGALLLAFLLRFI